MKVTQHTVLISGGTGLVGSRLTLALRERGHEVRILSRQRGMVYWDPRRGHLAEDAFDGVDAIVHLAGAGIADKRWSPARKRELEESRLGTTRLLAEALQTRKHQVKCFVAASAVGFYGSRGDERLDESSDPGSDFLAKLSQQWEQANAAVAALGIRLAILRIGIVLSRKGGALPELTKTLSLGVAGVLGSGRQFYPVIHVDDLARMFRFAVEEPNLQGVYNAVGPAPVRQRDLMRAILRASGRKAILAPVPEFGLRMVLGEMADAVLMSSRAGCQKIEEAGFRFDYPTVERMLEALYA
ncbi:MAG: TIGR01777 family protein [Bacteroidetes bacterium]|nr:TIGR01777 family protein [Bacteroidota bacterium]